MKITRRRYLLCGASSFFITILKPVKVLATNKISKQQQAELLTQSGHILLNKGQYLLAIQDWKEATKLYRQLGFEDGVTGNLVNQSLALQGLGLYLNAFDVLLEALRISKSTYSPTSFKNQDPQKLYLAIHKIKLTPVNLLALQNLAEVLRLLGNLNESEAVLQEIIQSQTPNPYFNFFLLSLANTKKSKYYRSISQYKWIEELILKKDTIDEIQNNALSALKLYQQINNLENTPKDIKLKSQLNNLSLLLNFQEWVNLQKNQDFVNKKNISQKIQNLIALIFQNYSLFDELSASQSVYAKIDFANNLYKTTDKQLQHIAIQFAESALTTAESLDNKLLQSFCWGTLGKLNPGKSEIYFNKALGFAQSIQAWDIAYQWQQQLADLYGQQGKFKEASHFYEAAITNLQQVRGNLLSTNPDTQFFFNEKIEPVYRNYLRLLIAKSNPDYQKVILTNEEFKITELENYLQCGKLNLVSLNEIKDSDSTIIHIIDLVDTLEVISQSSNSIHHHSIDSTLIREHINNILEILQSRNFAYTTEETILSDCQILYKLLIAPIQNLASSKILVFILDTTFQSIPMGILHDGNSYLITHYAITYTMGSKIQFPKFLDSSQLRALVAGISKESPSFSAANAPEGLKPLPGVEAEIASIKEEITSTKILLNEQFVSSMLDKELTTDNFPIIHLTTHAQFSSLADKTMILAWDKPITILEFNDLLKEKMQQSKKAGLELLVLSACQTAKGNKRSALGIAGVAAQAGARSTIASLWQVDADSTALLMKIFYKGLKNNLTKSEALRQAQLQMLLNPKYQHPFNWAAFLLVGAWL
ncbi:CHAT domain-containing protein [Aulosira sp. FACHB-615]|uniref:CHAT domain-containing protein n=1 Tax=Aulosira sp. FACHB-615 TaxID=2692777 RepID=UPI0016883942|nr:CHAT domain-containing protein [Aulosira sp. FACHB-615]MBD2491220.1 CHAT domain-containing protein [Aulosira sp. FACHB-615]